MMILYQQLLVRSSDAAILRHAQRLRQRLDRDHHWSNPPWQLAYRCYSRLVLPEMQDRGLYYPLRLEAPWQHS